MSLIKCFPKEVTKKLGEVAKNVVEKMQNRKESQFRFCQGGIKSSVLQEVTMSHMRRRTAARNILANFCCGQQCE